MRFALFAGLLAGLLLPLVIFLNNAAGLTVVSSGYGNQVLLALLLGCTLATATWYSPPRHWEYYRGDLGMYLVHTFFSSLVVTGIFFAVALVYLLVLELVLYGHIPHRFPFLSLARFITTSGWVSVFVALILSHMLLGGVGAPATVTKFTKAPR